jgi:hypothetical protein
MLIPHVWYFDYIGVGGREKYGGTKEDEECTTDRDIVVK